MIVFFYFLDPCLFTEMRNNGWRDFHDIFCALGVLLVLNMMHGIGNDCCTGTFVSQNNSPWLNDSQCHGPGQTPVPAPNNLWNGITYHFTDQSLVRLTDFWRPKQRKHSIMISLFLRLLFLSINMPSHKNGNFHYKNTLVMGIPIPEMMVFDNCILKWVPIPR